jgi:hypothetical protein
MRSKISSEVVGACPEAGPERLRERGRLRLSPVMRDLQLFMLLTGMRRTASVEPRIEHFDEERGCLRVPNPKGGESRGVRPAALGRADRPRAPPHRGEPDDRRRLAPAVPVGQRERPRRRGPRRRARRPRRARAAAPLRDVSARGRGADRRAKVPTQPCRQQRGRDDGLPPPIARPPPGVAGEGNSPHPLRNRSYMHSIYPNPAAT